MKSWEKILAKILAKIIKEEILEDALLIKINFIEKKFLFHEDAASIETSKKKLERMKEIKKDLEDKYCKIKNNYYEIQKIDKRKIILKKQVNKIVFKANKIASKMAKKYKKSFIELE